MRAARLLTSALAVAALVVGLAPSAAAAPATGGPPYRVVASGLDNPRHLQFGDDGVLFVAEAGTGGTENCRPGPEGGTVCFGSTGAITAIRGGSQKRVVEGLPSNAGEGGASALGPSDVAPGRRGLLVTIGYGGDPAARATLDPKFQDTGWLLSANPSTGTTRRLADIAGFEGSANPDGVSPPDSDPNAVIADGSGAVVVDAGGNSMMRVSRSGAVSLIATFPTRLQTVGVAVPGGPPVGAQIPAQSVPTSVTKSGGGYVVGELTGFPFAQGGAQVYRVTRGQPNVLAEGFTNIIDVEVASGSLYVLEIAKDGLLSAAPGTVPTGALLRVNRDRSVTTLAELPAPGGLAVRGNTAYVTTNAVLPGAGQVVAVPLR
jgi:hypothetical protein